MPERLWDLRVPRSIVGDKHHDGMTYCGRTRSKLFVECVGARGMAVERVIILSPQFRKEAGLYKGLRRPLYNKQPNGAKKLTRVVLMQDIRPDVS